jgi:hypothetical protein
MAKKENHDYVGEANPRADLRDTFADDAANIAAITIDERVTSNPQDITRFQNILKLGQLSL